MENEHIQRQINFMIEQQARFDAQIAKITERQNQTTQVIASIADVLLRLTKTVERHDDILEWHNNILERHDDFLVRYDKHLAEHDKQIAEHKAEHEKQMAEHAKQMAEWREMGKKTDARLHALASLIERHISDKHGH